MRSRKHGSLIALVLMLSMPVAAQTQPYDVTIVFLGLVTFDVSKPDSPVVYIQNVRSGLDGVGDDKHSVDPHVAYILTSKKEMPPASAKNKYTDRINRQLVFDRASYEPMNFHYLELQGEEVRVNPANDWAQNGDIKDGYTNSGCKNACPTQEDQTSLCWQSSLKAARQPANAESKDDRYFGNSVVASDLIARIPILFGKLDAHVIGYGEDLHAYRFGFAAPQRLGSPSLKGDRAYAQETHWTFKAQGTPFVLDLNSFSGTIRHVAFDPTADGSLTIVIGNTMEGDTGPIRAPAGPSLDPHYTVYHRLVDQNEQGKGPIPYPTGEVCHGYTFSAALLSLNVAMVPPTRQPGHTKRREPTPGGVNCDNGQWP